MKIHTSSAGGPPLMLEGFFFSVWGGLGKKDSFMAWFSLYIVFRILFEFFCLFEFFVMILWYMCAYVYSDEWLGTTDSTEALFLSMFRMSLSGTTPMEVRVIEKRLRMVVEGSVCWVAIEWASMYCNYSIHITSQPLN